MSSGIHYLSLKSQKKRKEKENLFRMCSGTEPWHISRRDKALMRTPRRKKGDGALQSEIGKYEEVLQMEMRSWGLEKRGMRRRLGFSRESFTVDAG